MGWHAALAVIFLAVCSYLAWLRAWPALAGFGAVLAVLALWSFACRRITR